MGLRRLSGASLCLLRMAEGLLLSSACILERSGERRKSMERLRCVSPPRNIFAPLAIFPDPLYVPMSAILRAVAPAF